MKQVSYKMLNIKVQNVVATFSLNDTINLANIREAFSSECFFETLQDKRYTFRVVALRIRKPRITLLVYRTGKVVCTGAKTIEDAEQSADYFISRLRRLGFTATKKLEARIQNIVATADLKIPVDMEKLLDCFHSEKQFRAMYEPEQFPAAIVRFPVTQGAMATILLFSSGKVVCVGLTTLEQINEAICQINSKLEKLL